MGGAIGGNVSYDSVEVYEGHQIEVICIILQILQHFSVVHERWEVGIKLIIYKRHDFFWLVSPVN